jgi:hypothetical protein
MIVIWTSSSGWHGLSLTILSAPSWIARGSTMPGESLIYLSLKVASVSHKESSS